MNPITEKHDEAMDLAEKGFFAKIQGELNEYIDLTTQAYFLELEAANMLIFDFKDEPSRSVLFRSAASLAMQISKFNEAERLIALGLGGFPPPEIAMELRELYEEINFFRHLKVNGEILKHNEVQLSISGPSIAPGMIPSREFISRIEGFQAILYRTAERLNGVEYKEKRITASNISNFNMYVSLPRASSFAVTIKVGVPNQDRLPGFDQSPELIDEVLNCIELFNASREKELKEKIPDEAYYRNFVGLAKEMAPDGENVNLVGFTTYKEGKSKEVPFTIVKNKTLPVSKPKIYNESETSVILKGQLYYARSGSKSNNRIQIKENPGQKNKGTIIIVPMGWMADIVSRYFEEIVEVDCIKDSSGKLTLQDIRRI